MNRQVDLLIRAAIVLLAMFGLGGWLAWHNGGQAQPAGSLTISMTDAPDPVNPFDVVSYTITVENAGTADEADVVVEDFLTGAGTVQGATASQGSCDTPTAKAVSCALGTLAAGGTATIVVDKRASGPPGGTVEFVGVGSGSAASPAGGSGPSVPYGALAGCAAAAALALLAGGWYARRRWLR